MPQKIKMRKHIHRAKRIKDIRTVNKENPRVRPIIDLLNSHFYISRYHRGYRWGEQEINDLLDDLIEYHTKYKQISHFYCLQPILVRRKTWLSDNEQKINGWEVFDGQQRLITILIILNYLDSTNGEYMKEKLGENLCENTDFYTIDFETKAECKDFIQNK